MLSIQELRSSTLKELFQELEKTRKELLKARVSVKTKHEKNTSKVQKIKRYVAQVITILKEAEKEEKKAPVKAVKKVSKDEPKKEE